MDDALHYLTERIFIPRIALLWLFLTLGLLALGPGISRQQVLVPLVSGLYLLVFRLWDDLDDLDHDRLRHPSRCLGQSKHLIGFQMSVALMAVTCALLIGMQEGLRAGIAFMIALALAALLYRTSAMGLVGRDWRTAMILLKYPLLVALFADDRGELGAGLVAALSYLVPFADELRTEAPGPLWPAAVVLFGGGAFWFAFT